MMAGQKVICVDDKFPEGIGKFYDKLPQAGVTYLIRDVSLGVNLKGEPGEVAITLEGLVNPCSKTPPHPERAFNAERFRPLKDDRVEATAEKVETIGF